MDTLMLLSAAGTTSSTFGIDTLNSYMIELMRYLQQSVWTWGGTLITTARALGVIFALILVAREGYKVMSLQGNQLDILAIGKPLLFALLLTNWNVFSMAVMAPGNSIEDFFRTKFEAMRTQVDVNLRTRREKANQLATILWTKTAAAELVSEEDSSQTKNSDTFEIPITEENKDNSYIHKAWEGIKDAASGVYDATIGSLGNVINNVTESIGNKMKSLQFRAGTWVATLVMNFFIWLGETLWQVGVYFIFLLQALYKIVLVVFGPVYVICALVPAWGSAFTDWISKAVKVSLYGAMAYLVMAFSLVVIDFCLKSDIAMLDNLISQGGATVLQAMQFNIWGSFCQTVIAYLVGFIALLKAPAMADMAFPGASAGEAANNFLQGTAGKAASRVGI